MISPLAQTEDFARLLSYEELLGYVGHSLADPHFVLCSVVSDISEVRSELGESRAAALMRELVQLVRRNLRGTDAMAVQGEEMIVMLDVPRGMAERVAQRLLSAVRTHSFSGGAADNPVRLTLSIGLAVPPERDRGVTALLAAARAARAAAGRDVCGFDWGAPARALDVARFVGRAEPLVQLAALLDDSVRGVGQVVAVTGEVGVGTTSLLRALEPEVRLRGGSLVAAQCRESDPAVPYALWRDVLRGVHRLGIKSTRQWRELPALDPSLEGPRDDSPGVRSKIRLQEELADYLRLAAQQRPLTIHLEELQWVDDASWDALEYLIPQLENERTMICLSFRTGATHDQFDRWAKLASRSRHSEISLSPLTRDDVKRWLEGALREEVVGRDLLAHVYRCSGGNPLLVSHLLRDLEESGQLARVNGVWEWTIPAPSTPQASLHDLIIRRAARLPQAARVVLDAAAVLGRECDMAVLARMLEMQPVEIAPSLSLLAEADLLTPTFERVSGALVFTHYEVARAVRAVLSPEELARLHARAADVLSEWPNVSPIDVASHYAAAGETTDAHVFALRGADAAIQVYESNAAATLLSLAERTSPSAGATAEVRVRMAALADSVGHYEDAEALCDRAISWYRSQGEHRLALGVSRTRAMVRMRRGQPASALLSDLLELDAEAQQVGVNHERAGILLLISRTHWRLGDPHAARRVAKECLEIAEQGDDQVLLYDSLMRLAVTIQLEKPEEARGLLRRALALSGELRDYLRRVQVLHNLGSLELLTNNLEEAREFLRTAADEARTAGLTEMRGRAVQNSGVLAARVGDYELAVRLLNESLEICAMAQNSELQLYATYNLAHVQREWGNTRAAGHLYELVMALAERIGQAEVQDGACAGYALCRLDEGAIGEARRAGETIAPFHTLRTDWFQGRELGEALLIRLALLDGRGAEALAGFRHAVAMAQQTDTIAAAWMTAELSAQLRPFDPEDIQGTVERFAQLPEVVGSAPLLEKFSVLLIDSKIPS
jgi:tetratricopeptide (TPR) repeat protein/GGDEF domain-containing protein